MTSTFCINTSRIAHQTVDGETIVIDFENGAYYSTEGAGAVIWELIAKGATFEQILEVVTGRYQASPQPLKILSHVSWGICCRRYAGDEGCLFEFGPFTRFRW